MPSANDPKFLESLLLSVIERIDQISDKMDLKLDALSERNSGDYQSMRVSIEKRLSELDSDLESVTKKVQKHEHYFTTVAWIFGGGLATVASWFTWLGSFFQGKN